MGIDYKDGAINDTWESVQQRVRSYALDRNLMVSPDWQIPLEPGETIRLRSNA